MTALPLAGTAQDVRAAFERLGPILYTGFGMTETSGNLLAHPKSVHVRAVNGEPQLLEACGRPVCLAEAMIVRPDMHECEPHEVGELVMRGPQRHKGYHDDPAATEQRRVGGIDDRVHVNRAINMREELGRRDPLCRGARGRFPTDFRFEAVLIHH